MPFEGSSLLDTLKQQTSECLPDPREVNPTVSAACTNLLVTMTAKERSQRPGSWQEVLADLAQVKAGSWSAPAPGSGVSVIMRLSAKELAQVQAGQPVSRRPRTLAGAPAWKPGWVLAAAAGLVLLLAGLGAAGWTVLRNKGPAAGVTEGINARAVAVLPFTCSSADQKDEYLSDGFAEELLNTLARVPGLRVPARTSCFAFRGQSGDIRRIGAQLGVSKIVEGSLRKDGNKLKITARLINVANGYQLWSETFERDLKDILAVQTDVAERVAKALKVNLQPILCQEGSAAPGEISWVAPDSGDNRLEKKAVPLPAMAIENEAAPFAASPASSKRAGQTVNREAYQYYLQGRYASYATNAAELNQAAKYFKLALEKDPNYAPAYSGLANVEVDPETRKAYAKKALELAPASAEAHLAMAAVQGFCDWNLAESEREFRAALKLNPNLAVAHARLGWLLGVQGKTNEALVLLQQGRELDPLSPYINQLLAETYYFARQNEKAIAQARKVLELDRGYAPAYATLGWVYLQAGKRAQAQTAFAQAPESLRWPGRHSGSMEQSAYGREPAAGGHTGAGGSVATSNLEKAERLAGLRNGAKEVSMVAPVILAAECLAENEKETALDFLDEACAARDPACLQLKVNPAFDSLRGEPRFQTLLKKIGLEK
jgi:TolB-like protein/Tfp pilus assembly protein PilF